MIILVAGAATEELFPAERLARQLECATGVGWKLVRAVAETGPAGRGARGRQAGAGRRGAGEVRCVTDRGIRQEQGYRLRIGTDGVELGARTPEGMFYAMQTLAQIAWEAGAAGATKGGAWPAVRIEDEPDFLRRGVYLDCAGKGAGVGDAAATGG